MAIVSAGHFGCLFPGNVAKDASSISSAKAPLWGDLTLFEPPHGGFSKAGEVPEYSLTDAGLSVKSYLDRVSSLTLMAVALALGNKRNPDFGLAFGTRWGPLSSMKLFFEKVKQNPRFAPPLPFSHSYANSPASVAAIEFGLKGWHCVFSDEDVSGLDALIAAADEANRTSAAIVVAAADALSPELFAYYHSQNLMGLPSDDQPDKFVPAEAAVALLVEPDGQGRKISPLPPDSVKSASRSACHIFTDAYTRARASSFEHLSGAANNVTHVGLITGNTGAAGGLLALAAGCAFPEPTLIMAGVPDNPRFILLE